MLTLPFLHRKKQHLQNSAPAKAKPKRPNVQHNSVSPNGSSLLFSQRGQFGSVNASAADLQAATNFIPKQS